jgi:hypothetical protein
LRRSPCVDERVELTVCVEARERPDCCVARKRVLKHADIYFALVSLDTIGERIDPRPIRNL